MDGRQYDMLVHYPPVISPLQQGVDSLRRQIARLEGGQFPRSIAAASSENAETDIDVTVPTAAVSTGTKELDRLLPQWGLCRGTVVEWLGKVSSSGAQTLALLAGREACRDGKSLLVVDRARRFYPPAAAAWGIDLARLIVVHPANEADELWAIDQALRCRGIGAVWAQRDKLDGRDFRRLALAAESGETLGLLIRPAQVRGQPSWAQVQLLVSPRPSASGRRLRVEVTRCRGGPPGRTVELEIDEWTGHIGAEHRHETHFVRPAAELAAPATGRGVAV
jgi:protein ImuA